MAVAINDRTAEFRHIVTAAKKKHAAKPGSQRLLGDAQNSAAGANGPPRRSEFARNAAEIGRGISATMGKLEKLAQCRHPPMTDPHAPPHMVSDADPIAVAKKRSLFDDNPVEVNEVSLGNCVSWDKD